MEPLKFRSQKWIGRDGARNRSSRGFSIPFASPTSGWGPPRHGPWGGGGRPAAVTGRGLQVWGGGGRRPRGGDLRAAALGSGPEAAGGVGRRREVDVRRRRWLDGKLRIGGKGKVK
jgi:hypothetical protein